MLFDAFIYDPYGRLSNIHLAGNGYNKDVTWTYNYSAAGRITRIDESMRAQTDPIWNTATFTYGYDTRGRIISAARQSDGSSPSWQMSYTYDLYGNMLTKQQAGSGLTTFVVDPATNRMTTRKYDYSYYIHQNYPATYDAAGYLSADSFYNYSYNGMGLLKQVNSGQTGSYRYDAMGRRVKRTYSFMNNYGTESGTIIYVYGVDGQIAAEYKNAITPPYGNDVTTTNCPASVGNGVFPGLG